MCPKFRGKITDELNESTQEYDSAVEPFIKTSLQSKFKIAKQCVYNFQNTKKIPLLPLYEATAPFFGGKAESTVLEARFGDIAKQFLTEVRSKFKTAEVEKVSMSEKELHPFKELQKKAWFRFLKVLWGFLYFVLLYFALTDRYIGKWDIPFIIIVLAFSFFGAALILKRIIYYAIKEALIISS